MWLFGLTLFLASFGLAAAIPFLSAPSLGSLALVLALCAAAAAAVTAFRGWNRAARTAAGLVYGLQAAIYVLAQPQGFGLRHNQPEVALILMMILTTAFLSFRPERLNAWAEKAAIWLRGRRWAEGLAIAAISVLAFLGSAEFLAAALARTRLVPFNRPLVTYHHGNPIADWRPFHITVDRHRVADPVLLWRPTATPPYNSRGFKGPEFAVPKPPRTFRIIALGDSNTDGPDTGHWPGELDRLLAAPGGPAGHFEVINAGVVGYSSLQGLRRLEEVLRFAPDLILVSFGANDAHLVATGPDKGYAAPNPLLARALRGLFRYKAFLLARYIASRVSSPAAVEGRVLQPRVSLEDYEANLRRMVALARGASARVVLLTRPYDPGRRPGAPPDSWIRRAPDYNAVPLRLGRELEVPVFDAYRLFEHAGRDAFADDSHFTPAGHAKMAWKLLDFLVQERLLP